MTFTKEISSTARILPILERLKNAKMRFAELQNLEAA